MGLSGVRSWRSFALLLAASHRSQRFSEQLQSPGRSPLRSLSSPPHRSRFTPPSPSWSAPEPFHRVPPPRNTVPWCLQGLLPCLLQICSEVTFRENRPSRLPMTPPASFLTSLCLPVIYSPSDLLRPSDFAYGSGQMIYVSVKSTVCVVSWYILVPGKESSTL